MYVSIHNFQLDAPIFCMFYDIYACLAQLSMFLRKYICDFHDSMYVSTHNIILRLYFSFLVPSVIVWIEN